LRIASAAPKKAKKGAERKKVIKEERKYLTEGLKTERRTKRAGFGR
jgi:hypothetical protein